MSSPEALRIVYMGTPDFAVAPLERLVGRGFRIAGVVTVPDKPAGRGLQLQQSAVKRYALEHLPGVPLLQPERMKDPDFLEAFAALRPDVAVVVAFRMLPEAVWSLPRLGTFNLHASLLPQYRGAAPINWAVMNGERQSGVTTFLLDHQIDTGAVLLQRAVDIAADETAGSLHDRLMEVGAGLVVETVEGLADGTLTPRPQPSADVPRPAPKLFKEDMRLDFTRPMAEVYNKIRGLSPYPAAWCEWEGGVSLKIFAAHPVADASPAEAGAVRSDGKSHLRIRCADGWIEIDRLQPAGKRPMAAAEFLRGYRPVESSSNR